MDSIVEKIGKDTENALKARNHERLATLRLLRSAFHNAAIEAREQQLDDAAALDVLQREAKKRRESIEQYDRAGRSDLVDSERSELSVIEEYLPSMLGEGEVRKRIEAYLDAHPDQRTPEQFGAVMQVVMGELKGQADGKIVQRLVREMLTGTSA